MIYHCSKKSEIAIDYFKKALELGLAMGSQRAIAKTNFGLGICYGQLGRNEDALHRFKEVLRLMTAFGD